MQKTATFPVYTAGEMRADATVHALSLTAGTAAAVWLLMMPGGASQAMAHGLYAGGMLLMLAASAAYNTASPGRIKEALRRLDHAAIFGAIAATYTPFLLGPAGGRQGGVLCLAIWASAVLGAALKLLAPRRWERTGMVLYLLMGWAWLPAAAVLAQSLQPRTAALMLAGALLYTLGAAVHRLSRLPFHNPLWHLLVLLAAACHFLAIAGESLPASALL